MYNLRNEILGNGVLGVASLGVVGIRIPCTHYVDTHPSVGAKTKLQIYFSSRLYQLRVTCCRDLLPKVILECKPFFQIMHC